ncbi:MAG: YraN family protein [Victivallaceae bacterium]|nr:YraN family protein [Victivallaceae bacterium]
MKGFGKKRAAHLKLGDYGEKKARQLLLGKSYALLAGNYNCYAGEVDLVARDGAVLVFIEVKTRSNTTRSRPASGLRLKQQQRIYRAGMHYWNEIGRVEAVIRFDLVEVVVGRYGVKELRHWRNHFSRKTIF